ncbi:putative transcription factor WRKY family [Helianthus annuus]|uniref:Transcription factor WRKY family n=1 Tax=Helianthus annuus TaxID=4232 RepID=A0A9K3HVC3_HELAN|nr:probable WRKY transcription factor 70 [Helianthus annuus]KAF5785388.1 putative transcription factor WRKY family [Helianthus annuus]KAJ0512955.1 putative transcription factor WRKY family [Helianthus annuus]KAJ0529076.1 putative transcription factor WRKY family [Helianthus annuus]KAJ0699484.1 putative transcription factor WRKY family [Helianthus annuus]KAJ0882768.1 putative transcription factor WRKY family [Helianthus annuus]
MLHRPYKIESDIKPVSDVTIQISGMFDNTRSILSSTHLNGILHNPSDVRSSNSSNYHMSQVSDSSIKTMKPAKTKRGTYKRRKNVSTITKVITTLIDDGYAWRKYGQKTIFNSKYQRNYYRCSHKIEQGCQATKQVQKIDDKPSKYKITYDGVHTCNNLQSATQIILEAPDPRDKSTLISFETNAFTENHKVGSCFQSMKHTPMDFPSLEPLDQKQVYFSDHKTQWDSILELSQVPSEPISMMLSGLDCEDMVSPGVYSSTCSTHGYEIDDIKESYDYAGFLFEL